MKKKQIIPWILLVALIALGARSITDLYMLGPDNTLVSGATLTAVAGSTVDLENATVTLPADADNQVASEVGFTPAGTIEASDVQAAIEEVASEAAGGHTIEDEGTPVTDRSSLNFAGAGVAVTDSGGKTLVTVAGGAAPVASVNALTGVVVLDPDDLDDTATTNKFMVFTSPDFLGVPTFGNGATSAGSFLLKEDSDAGSETLKIITPALASSYTMTLPDAVPAINSAFVTMDTDGTMDSTNNPVASTLNLYGANSLTLGTGSSFLGQVTFKNDTNGNTFVVQPGVTGANIEWTLPTAAPGGANYLLNADVDGTMGYTDPAGLGTDDQTASEVPNTPAGAIAATDVQAALNELDSEKAAHTNDTITDMTYARTRVALGALEIDVTEERTQTKTISADTVFTFSVDTPVVGFQINFELINSDTSAHAITIPSSYSLAGSGTITEFNIPASTKADMYWRYNGSVYDLYGETYSISDLAEDTTPDSGEWFLMQGDDGLSYKVDVDNMPGASDLNDPVFVGTVAVGDGTTGSGIFQIDEDDDDGANFASFQVPALAANTVYILPPDDGDDGDRLQTNGTGTLTWETPSAGDTDFDATLGTDDTYEGLTITGLDSTGVITQWEVVYIDGSGDLAISDADAEATAASTVGVAVSTTGGAAALTYIYSGTIRNDAWDWTPGAVLWLDVTAGGITETQPSGTGDIILRLGVALSADAMFVQIDGTYDEVQ